MLDASVVSREGHPRALSEQLFLFGIVYDKTDEFYGYGPTFSLSSKSSVSMSGCCVVWDSMSVNEALGKPSVWLVEALWALFHT